MPLFKRAIELDPGFALAHAHLAQAYSGLSESVLAERSAGEAYRLRDRASEQERLFIEGVYQRIVTGNVEKGREVYELWAQTYPRDWTPHGFLSGLALQNLGRYEESIIHANAALALNPEAGPPYVNRAWSGVFLNRPDDAERDIRVALESKPELSELLVVQYYASFLKGDANAMERAAASAAGKTGVEDWIVHSQAAVLARSGRLRQAREKWRQAMDMARHERRKRKGRHLRNCGCGVGCAVRQSGRGQEGSGAGAGAVGRPRGGVRQCGRAGVRGRSIPAEGKPTNYLEKHFGEDTSAQFNYLPALRALGALSSGDVSRALDALQPNLRYEKALTMLSGFAFISGMYPAYVRGEAYLRARKFEEASAEFRKILDNPGIVLADPLGAVARVQFGRSLKMSGQIGKAKAAYEDFFALWKDSDRDVPLLLTAKAEYAKL